MKNFRIFIFALLTVFLLGCKNDTKLRAYTEVLNRLCPISLGKYATMDDVTYADGTVTMTYTVADGVMNYESVRNNEDVFRRNMITSFANNDDENLKKLLDAIIDADAQMCVVFKEKEEDGMTVCFTAEELKEGTADQPDDPYILLQSLLDNTKLQTPHRLAEGLVMTDVRLDGNYFVYVYECDEDLYDIGMMQQNLSFLKQAVMSELNPDDALLGQMIDVLQKTGKGLAYQYTGSKSGQTATVYIESDELKR